MNTFFAQYYYPTDTGIDTGQSLIYLALAVLAIAGMWRVFSKAKQPGWAAIIPFYNIIVLLKVARRPLWWFFLYLIPFVNFIVHIVVSNDIAKTFGKGVGMTLLLVFLPFIGYPVLGFGASTYKIPKKSM